MERGYISIYIPSSKTFLFKTLNDIEASCMYAYDLFLLGLWLKNNWIFLVLYVLTKLVHKENTPSHSTETNPDIINIWLLLGLSCRKPREREWMWWECYCIYVRQWIWFPLCTQQSIRKASPHMQLAFKMGRIKTHFLYICGTAGIENLSLF